jgi:hypothetical protein
MNKTTVLAAAVSAVVLWPALGAAAADPGQVLAVRRDAVVLRQAKSIPARAEMPLLLDDAVATGAQSRAKLFFQDDSILNLGEKSRVQIKEYLASPENQRSKSVYQLLDGSLKVVVGRSDLEIHTQTAVAAARGTVFILWSEGTRSDRSCLMVLDGTVTLRNRDKNIPGEVSVPAGQMSCVPLLEPPGRLAANDDSLMKKLLGDTLVLGPGERGKVPDPLPVFGGPRGAIENPLLPPLDPQLLPGGGTVQGPVPPAPPVPGAQPPPEEQQRR